MALNGMDMMMDALKRFIPSAVWDVIQTNVSKMAAEVKDIQERGARIEAKLDLVISRLPPMTVSEPRFEDTTQGQLLDFSQKEHPHGPNGQG